MRTVMQWRDLPAEAEEWIARIEAVRPLIRQYRDYAEEQGEAHPKVIAELCKLGFSRLCVSKDFGGQQRDIRVISQIVQRLAALDTSVSWPQVRMFFMPRSECRITNTYVQQADGDGLNVRVGLAGSMLSEHAVNTVGPVQMQVGVFQMLNFQAVATRGDRE